MLRREFLLGAAASVAASSPLAALAAEGPPLSSKAAFVAWMTANRPAEESKYLERRWDRYEVVISFNDLWTAADKRAFLMTPRQEFCLPENREDAYVGHYLDIGFGVTITPPGTMGRMTSAIQVHSDKVLEIGKPFGVKPAGLGAREIHVDVHVAQPRHQEFPAPLDHRRIRRQRQRSRGRDRGNTAVAHQHRLVVQLRAVGHRQHGDTGKGVSDHLDPLGKQPVDGSWLATDHTAGQEFFQ